MTARLRCTECDWTGTRKVRACGKDDCTPQDLKHQRCLSDPNYAMCPRYMQHVGFLIQMIELGVKAERKSWDSEKIAKKSRAMAKAHRTLTVVTLKAAA